MDNGRNPIHVARIFTYSLYFWNICTVWMCIYLHNYMHCSMVVYQPIYYDVLQTYSTLAQFVWSWVKMFKNCVSEHHFCCPRTHTVLSFRDSQRNIIRLDFKLNVSAAAKPLMSFPHTHTHAHTSTRTFLFLPLKFHVISEDIFTLTFI